MKILQVLTHLNVGGIPTYVYGLAKYLKRNDIEVAVASSGGVWEEELKKLDVPHFHLDIKTKSEFSPKLLTGLGRLKAIHQTFPFDLLHSHTRVTQVLCQLYARLHHATHVANFHGFYAGNKKRWGRRLIKAQGKLSIAITPQTADELVQCFGADRRRIRTIISAIDLERFNTTGTPLKFNTHPAIGASGRLSPIKGFNYLIEAMPQILRQYPRAVLYLCGQGEEEANLNALARRLNVSEQITFMGHTDLASLLPALDIFCLPSLDEPLGLAILEAQYFGLPVIASNVGGVPCIVKPEETGLLVAPGNSAAIADAAYRILSDNVLREKLKNNSRRVAREEFDLAKKIQAFIAVYKEALE